MIDRETAIQWATDAGFEHSYLCMGYWIANVEQIHALITHAQNEAYEAAARKAVGYVGCEGISEAIRAMKHNKGF